MFQFDRISCYLAKHFILYNQWEVHHYISIFFFWKWKQKNALTKGYQRIVGWNNLLLHCKCLQGFTRVFVQHLQGKPYNNYKISLQSVNILYLVVFNPYLRTDSAKLLILFSVKDPKTRIYKKSNSFLSFWHFDRYFKMWPLYLTLRK